MKIKTVWLGLPAWLIIMAAGPVSAQWPDDPALNKIICDRMGEQTLPKISMTSDGGCYVSWHDHASGNYDVYLQRLNGDGQIQWLANGILISNHIQESWITDYDMAVDGADHAILTFNDSRNGSDRDIYAYRISPAGNFVWGPDGITISANDGFEPDPRVAVTSSGNIVIAWQEDLVVHLRKLTPSGLDVWDPPTITLTSTYGLSVPRIVPTENDGIILQVLDASGPNYYNPKYIYQHKFDSIGTDLWGGGGVPVSTAGGIAVYMKPDLKSDGAGGSYSFWYDTRNSVHHVYAQHITNGGIPAWTTNGVLVSSAAGQLQMNPSLARIYESNDIIVTYKITNTNQSQFGICAQKLNSAGALQWGTDGVTLVPLSDQDRNFATGFKDGDGAIVVYEETPTGGVNSIIKAIKIDGAGSPVWDPSPITICSTMSEKIHFTANGTEAVRVIAVWGDKRGDSSGDIYLQNINPDGTIGPSVPPGCDYVVGDVNGSDTYNGLDITFGVAYFKGGTPPAFECECPTGNTWFVSGDVNGSCSYNGLDITYGVSYLKGGSALQPCPDCPPID